MDWLTGCWFEFNDEKVSLLEDGPSCSYIVQDDGSVQSGTKSSVNNKPKKVGGSQDAYNLYYVEENYHAQSIYETLWSPMMPIEGISSNEQVSSVLEQTLAEAKQEYAKLTK
jgi:hypothetical protein